MELKTSMWALTPSQRCNLVTLVLHVHGGLTIRNRSAPEGPTLNASPFKVKNQSTGSRDRVSGKKKGEEENRRIV